MRAIATKSSGDVPSWHGPITVGGVGAAFWRRKNSSTEVMPGGGVPGVAGAGAGGLTSGGVSGEAAAAGGHGALEVLPRRERVREEIF